MKIDFLTINRKKKRVGRGGVRGNKSGRGDKGQRSRAGRRIRPALRDEIQRLPKRRGYNKNRARGVRTGGKEVRTVTLSMLEKNFDTKEKITPRLLVEKNMTTNIRGRVPSVKIVAGGDITKSLTIKRCLVSPGAKDKIEAVGGTVSDVPSKKKNATQKVAQKRDGVSAKKGKKSAVKGRGGGADDIK